MSHNVAEKEGLAPTDRFELEDRIRHWRQFSEIQARSIEKRDNRIAELNGRIARTLQALEKVEHLAGYTYSSEEGRSCIDALFKYIEATLKASAILKDTP